MSGADEMTPGDGNPVEEAVAQVEAARTPDHRRRWFPSSAPGWVILISVIAVALVASVAVRPGRSAAMTGAMSRSAH